MLAKEKPFAREAADRLAAVSDAEVIFGAGGDVFPEHVCAQEYDYIFSYIAPWIIPQRALDRARIAAVNFHPGPPEYPGTGCTNFAIYDGATEFGVTAHHMDATVDTGAIILVERFPILADDSVFALTQRCYEHIFSAFTTVLGCIVRGERLPAADARWTRKPYTRKQLNELCGITKDMADDEVRRRVRATTYPGMPGATMTLAGTRFIAAPEQGK